MIARHIAGLVILALITIGGAIAYLVLRIKVRDAESDLMIVKKKDLKGRDSDYDPKSGK